MKTEKAVCLIIIAILSVAHISAGRSLRTAAMKAHKLQKRSSTTLEETCPPPYEFLNKKCNDTCTDDDDCPSHRMCCYDGCAYTCLEPLPSIPVVDWVDYERDVQDKLDGEDKTGSLEERYPIAEPIIESLDCEHEGKILPDGESFTRGCYHCQCSGGYIMCEVSRCRNNVQARQEASGEGSEESSGDDELGARIESSGQVLQVIGLPRDGSDEDHLLSEHHEGSGIGDDELGARLESLSGQVRQVIGLPRDESDELHLLSEHQEGSGIGDEGSSPEFVPYRSVKLKRKW